MIKVRDIVAERSEWIASQDYETVTPLVTVLLPTFQRNYDGLFEAAVRSVLDQDFNNLELIIIDDCSQDGTFELIKRIMREDGRVSCIRHTSNIGLPAISEYEGLRKARGQYIAFLFDDNEWQLGALGKTIALMQEENVRASFGITSYKDRNGELRYLGDKVENIDNLAVNNFIGNGSVVLHREVIAAVGFYDPHLVLTRVCDWDLWRRLIKKFEFFATNIHFTFEKGDTLEDSLGQTYSHDYWCALEHMQYDRDALLTLDTIEAYEIDGGFQNKSDGYCEYLKNNMLRYELKDWFGELAKTHIDSEDEASCSNRGKRVGILCSSVDASIVLTFGRLFQDSSECVMRYYLDEWFSLFDTDELDVLIVSRNIYRYRKIAWNARKLGIKTYYFVDDNFPALSEEFPSDHTIKVLAEYTTQENLACFDGVIVSSPELKGYFTDSGLSSHVALLSPSMGKTITGRQDSEKLSFNLAFLGGDFRFEALGDFVLPALRELSEKYDIVLYCPETLVGKIEHIDVGKMSVRGIPRTLSLDQALVMYADRDICIQVHPGLQNNNNRYKTENALINATQMSAVLVASAQPPFVSGVDMGQAYLSCENTVQAWETSLGSLMEDKQLRIELYKNAQEICKVRYNPKSNTKTLISILGDIDRADAEWTVNRDDPFRLALRDHRQSYIPMNERRYLVCENEVREYRCSCMTENPQYLGLIFGTPVVCEGVVTITVSYKNNVFCRTSLDMAIIDPDEWNYFSLEGVRDNEKGIYDVSVEFTYSPESSKLTICENDGKRSIFLRAMKRLGFNYRKMDVLLTDWVGPTEGKTYGT